MVLNASFPQYLLIISHTSSYQEWIRESTQQHTKNIALAMISLAQPDPYARGEGLVTCYTRSCSAVAYRLAPIRLQLFCVAMVTRGRNNRALLFNIAHLLDAMIGKLATQLLDYYLLLFLAIPTTYNNYNYNYIRQLASY